VKRTQNNHSGRALVAHDDAVEPQHVWSVKSSSKRRDDTIRVPPAMSDENIQRAS
jgi:hypothetical protein